MIVKMTTINLATQEILAEYDAITPEQVNHKVKDYRELSNYGLKELVNVKSVMVSWNE